ncbi:MAG TPA: UbiA family prenyltransferase [Pyrinomonadaceae bacterium]
MRLRAAQTHQPAGPQRPGLSQTVRAFEWWEFKLAPIFATAYATAYTLQLPLASLWPLFILVLAALVPGAAYVSVLNDLTDIEEDIASGKPNRLAGRSRWFAAALLLCCVLPGAALMFYWRRDPLLLGLYLAAWVAFTLYSVRPFRLKSRGLPGLLADASGAHLFPTLVVVVLVYRFGGALVDPQWFTVVAVWALCLGLRGNLWHQLSDLRNDARVGLRTFASRHKITLLRGLGNFVIFPAEAAAFALILWRAGSVAALVALLFYALLEGARRVAWGMRLVVVVPKERASIVMLEYYEVFFPAALIISSALRHPSDALVLAAHLLLFRRRPAQCLKDAFNLLRHFSPKVLRGVRGV